MNPCELCGERARLGYVTAASPDCARHGLPRGIFDKMDICERCLEPIMEQLAKAKRARHLLEMIAIREAAKSAASRDDFMERLRESGS